MTTLEEMKVFLQARAEAIAHGTDEQATTALEEITEAIEGPNLFAATLGYFIAATAECLLVHRAAMPMEAMRSAPFAPFPFDESTPVHVQAGMQLITARVNGDRDMEIALVRPWVRQDPYTEEQCGQLLGFLVFQARTWHQLTCPRVQP